MTINGKTYPMWGSFVENKDRWIGGVLHETSYDAWPPGVTCDPAGPTEITDVKLEPNGKDSAVFSIIGKDYTCACDVRYLGVGARGDGKRGFMLCGFGGLQFTIEPAAGKDVQVIAE